MRISQIFLAIVTLASVALSASPAKAQWCAYYEPMIYNCGFTTLEQCVANVTGLGGACSQDRRAVSRTPEVREPRRRHSKKRRKPGA